jgi:hypothetical protein
MYPEATKHPGDRLLPGQVFVADKGLPVPGAGGTAYTEPPPFFLSAGKRAEELPGVAMGIGEHILLLLPDYRTVPQAPDCLILKKR